MHNLETKSLNLRLLNNEDYQILFPLHSNPEVMKYIRQPDSSLEQTKERMSEMFNYNKKNPSFGIFLAFEKISGQCIGWVLFIHAELKTHMPVEVGYRLFPEFWGKGYATELTLRMVKYGFETLNLDKVCAVTRPDNIASKRVLEKGGLTLIDEREFYGQNCSYFEVEK